MSHSQVCKGILLSDFNIDNFSAYLNNDQTSPIINTTTVSLDQVIPSLIQKDLEIWKTSYDFVLTSRAAKVDIDLADTQVFIEYN